MDQKDWTSIASQFALPERQAKVKQLLKINDDSEKELWCICRSSDCSTFMIGCDKCDEWYHGTCIGLKERESKKIKRYFCQFCRDKDPSLEIQYKPQYAEQMQRKKQKRLRAIEEESVEPVTCKRQKVSDSAKVETPKQKYTIDTPNRQPKSAPRQHISATEQISKDERKLLQCFGPGCTESARPSSKYCSDDCGMNLARNRIFELLPWRVSQWVATPSVADIRNQKDLEGVRQERQNLHVQLSLLDRKMTALESLIKRAKSLSPTSSERDSISIDGPDGSDEAAADCSSGKSAEEVQLDCVSCGNPQPFKAAFRHMERCFARLECQTTCWSIMSTRIEGDSMLCDYYSPQFNMYCKRLKHICPEHYKEEKSDTEVCGCPLLVPGGLPLYEVCYAGDGNNRDCSAEKNYSDFCRQLKSRCNRHPYWDRLRRAHIDLERFKLWSRLEELMERENHIRLALSQRAGVVSLLLNETVDCNPQVSLTKKTQTSPKAQGLFSSEHDYAADGTHSAMDTSEAPS